MIFFIEGRGGIQLSFFFLNFADKPNKQSTVHSDRRNFK